MDNNFYSGIVGFELTPELERLRAFRGQEFTTERLNRAILKRVYSCGLREVRNTDLVRINPSLYMADIFWEIVDDICNTRADLYPIAEELLELGSITLAAFPKGRVVKIQPCPAKVALNDDDLVFLGITHDQAKQDWRVIREMLNREAHELYDRFHVDQVMELMQDAHQKMLEFITALINTRGQRVKPELIELAIFGDSTDVEVTFGKKPFSLTPARKRVVACLALLSKKDWFTVEEFSALYCGKEPRDNEEARFAYDRAISGLKRSIPDIKLDKDNKGRRRSLNYEWSIRVSDKDLLTLIRRWREKSLT